MSRVPSVQFAGLVSVAPLSGLLRTVPFGVVGAPPKSDRDIPSVNLRVITPNYLAAIGTRIVDGRSVVDGDRARTAHVALVSQALARRFLEPHPIGRHVLIHDNSNGPRPLEVVGVVEDVRQTALDTPPTFDLYIPLRQVHPEGVGMLRDNQFWMIRANADPTTLRAPFLASLREVDPDAAVSGPGPLRAFVDASLGPRRFNLALFAAFSLTAVLLAVSGVYALVSYGVSQRRREIGLRLAIGATADDVRGMILLEAARLVGGGLAIGAAAAIGARPLIAWVDRDAALDPAFGVLIAALLIAVVLGAAWLPARRAARIEPSVVLNG
jgi:putative ABC transport system permease protein